MNKIFLTATFLGLFFFPGHSHASVDTTIYVENVMAEMVAPMKYAVSGDIFNTYDEKREVVLRAQITFFDRGNPPGDVPQSILRKDITVILQPHESKQIRVELLNEGNPPHGAPRMEPMLRIRRDREWTY